MAQIPADKRIAVFGRGSWHYVDYEADYRWQRYLYASYLLGKRERDLFKFHSSFQVPAHAGRSGGLDIYADWNVDIGLPKGPYRVDRGLYVRDFALGRVVVAPDDGRGGSLDLELTWYTLEGESLTGTRRIEPGEALILVNSLNAVPRKLSSKHISAGQIAELSWRNTSVVGVPGSRRVLLKPLDKDFEGEHDLLLDFERSLVPFRELTISATLLAETASILAVAEVDDPAGKHSYFVVAINRSTAREPKLGFGTVVQFRTRTKKTRRWPYLRIGIAEAQKIKLDGETIFASTSYQFRRWSHLRLEGPLEISSVRLSSGK